MAYKSSYTKDIEDYFLSLAGKGIMLSSKDYDLISNWRKRKIPKEVILKGIRKAFDERMGGLSDNRLLPKLNGVAPFVEEAIKNYQISLGRESVSELESDKKDVIQQIAERLSTIIKSETREKVKRHYIETRKRILGLLNSDIEDVFKLIRAIEEGFYQDFFEALSKTEQNRIMMEAEQRISKKARFMTEQARRESVLSFRNEILKREYKLKSIVAGD